MGQKDLYQSDFYEDKGRFADVFNGVLFDGRRVMKPEVLKRHSADGMVDKESAKAILGIINEKINLEKIMKKDEHDREVYDMCQAFEDYKEEGRIEGREEAYEKIISIMKELNVAAETIREQLMEKFSFSASEVDEKMKKYY